MPDASFVVVPVSLMRLWKRPNQFKKNKWLKQRKNREMQMRIEIFEP